jgi:FimV-like protein
LLQNPTPLNAFKMTPANSIDGGSPVLGLLPPRSLSEPVSVTRDAGGGMSQLDRLEAESKALRQQALSTQASIQQLQLVEQGGHLPAVEFTLPVSSGTQGALLGIGVLFFLGALWWYTSRRTQIVPAAQTSGFVDSSYFPLETHAPPESPIHTRFAPEAVAGADKFITARQLSTDSGFDSSFVQEDGSSSFESSRAHDQVTEGLRQEANRDHAGHSRAARRSDAFDPDVAAEEVERVRKFLAEKRADRTMRRVHEASQRQNRYRTSVAPQSHLGGDIFADYQTQEGPDSLAGHLKPLKSVFTEPDFSSPSLRNEFSAVATPTQDEPDLTAESRKLALELWDSGGHAIRSDPEFLLNVLDPDWELSMADMDYGVSDPFDLSAAEFESEEAVQALSSTAVPDEIPDGRSGEQADDDLDFNPEVQLALAHEFESLGLFQGARKLAIEVLESANQHLRAQAQDLLSKLDDHELAQDQGLLPLMVDYEDRIR